MKLLLSYMRELVRKCAFLKLTLVISCIITWIIHVCLEKIAMKKNFRKGIFQSEQQLLAIEDLLFLHLASIYEQSGREILHSWLDSLACFPLLISTLYIV